MALVINLAFVFWIGSGSIIFKLLLALLLPFLLMIFTYLIVSNLPLLFNGRLLSGVAFSLFFISLSVIIWSFLLKKKQKVTAIGNLENHGKGDLE